MIAYACGTPIRKQYVQAAGDSVGAKFIPDANPKYMGGDAIVWGLIRGSPKLISEIRAAGHDYWHMDNGYFGRNHLFRITKNANQRTDLIERPALRWERIKKLFKLDFAPYRKDGGKIIIAQSTEHLYKFMGTDIRTWTDNTVKTLRKNTDREIIVRTKKDPIPIENVLPGTWALVTHTSAAALDALRSGVPVFTTGECCARQLALQDLTRIESPIYPEREPLFRHLAFCMFTKEELRSGMWKEFSEWSRSELGSTVMK